MNEKEKAIELVGMQFGIIAKSNGFTVRKLSIPGNLKKFKELESVAKQCATNTVDEIIRLANRSDLFKMRTKNQHVNNSPVDETYVEYWDEVKKQIATL